MDYVATSLHLRPRLTPDVGDRVLIEFCTGLKLYGDADGVGYGEAQEGSGDWVHFGIVGLLVWWSGGLVVWWVTDTNRPTDQ